MAKNRSKVAPWENVVVGDKITATFSHGDLQTVNTGVVQEIQFAGHTRIFLTGQGREIFRARIDSRSNPVILMEREYHPVPIPLFTI